MMKIAVQKFLLERSLSDLRSEKGVKSRISGCGYKTSLSYSQIEASNSCDIAKDCRGLILSRVDNSRFDENSIVGATNVVARPFTRFFNVGQNEAASVNFTDPSTRFYEKADGTLTIVYFDTYQNKWHVATRGVAEADNEIMHFESYTFRSLFEEAILQTVGITFDQWANKLNSSFTYMFELCTPLNQIVVKHEAYKLYFLGARETLSGIEQFLHSFDENSIGVPFVKTYRFGSLTDMVDFVAGRDPMDYEGIIAMDNNFNRVKCKNSEYVALGRVKDAVTGSTKRGVMQLILAEKLDDALPLIPDFVKEDCIKLRDKFQRYFQRYNALYSKCEQEAQEKGSWGSHEHRKTFAVAAKRHDGWMQPMMHQYQGKSNSLANYLEQQRLKDGRYSNNFIDSMLYVLGRS